MWSWTARPSPCFRRDCPSARTAPTTPRCFAPPSTRPSLTTGTGHEVSPSNFNEFYVKQRAIDPLLWLLAWDGDELAGFVLASSGRGSEPELGWVGTLGVRPAWRRRGLGEALLRSAFAELFTRGHRRVGLGVDTENVSGALRLYERVGVRPLLPQRQLDVRARERAACPLPRLPYADGGRDGPEYQCHSCGREFECRARARPACVGRRRRGDGPAAAHMYSSWPGAAVADEGTLLAQPARPPASCRSGR